MEVRFQNFRCFKDTGRVPIKPITLLIGENSSGKTSFLAALNHVFGLLNGEDVDLNTDPFELGSFREVVHRNERSKSSRSFISYKYFSELHDEVTWKFCNNLGDMKLFSSSIKTSDDEMLGIAKNDPSLRLLVSFEERTILKELGFGVRKLRNLNAYDISPPEGFEFKQRFRRSSFSSNVQNIFNLRYSFGLSLQSLLYRRSFADANANQKSTLEKTSDGADQSIRYIGADGDEREKFIQSLGLKPRKIIHRLSKKIDDVVALAPLRNRPQRAYFFGRGDFEIADPTGENVPAKLRKLSRESKGKWLEIKSDLVSFGKVAGLFENIEINRLGSGHYPFKINITLASGQTSNICDVGYGVSQILPLLFEVISSKGGTLFLIQQPEVHLHPKAQAQFASLIATLTKTGKRFIVETHSDFILDRLTYEISKNDFTPSDVGLLFFDQSNGTTRIHPIELGEDGLPVDVPNSYRKFFLEDVQRVWR